MIAVCDVLTIEFIRQVGALELHNLSYCNHLEIYLRYKLAVFLQADGSMQLLYFVEILREVVRFQEGHDKGQDFDHHLFEIGVYD